jgi:molybdate transport system substrate-binding protein
MKQRLLLAGVLLMLCSAPGHVAERVVTVFAASSMTNVLEDVGKAYTARSMVPVRFSFAGSSALARQLESGAPADVFVSADQLWMDYVAARGLIQPAMRADVAANSLVLVAPADSPVKLTIAPGFALAAALGAKGRLATGDPQTVPVGRYAKGALEQLDVWESVAGRIVAADNVRSALNFVALGEVPLGIVYATDAVGVARVRVVATFPAASHPRITYPAATTVRGGSQAADFVRFLQGDEAQALFRKHGFMPP